MMCQRFTIPKGRNHYCGPAALAYITRTDPDTAAAHFRRVGSKRAIRAVSLNLMVRTLTALGVQFSSYISDKRTPTLRQWWMREERSGLWLIIITGHYIVVDGHTVYDNKHRGGVSIYLSPYLRRRVRAAWRIQ